ncbi:MAG TPA: hypothetical protein VGT60_07005 [Candidatus Limnocylindria bacterium]|nr:hypothetical protein [Candidatus Limnocylindria bacterium]
MTRYPPADVFDLEPAPPARTPERRALLDLRGWMFLGMGLAGILTVALIVTADESYAGIDGLRAVRAFVPQNEQDRPAVEDIPFLGGIAAAIHDIAPDVFAPTPDAVRPSDPLPVALPLAPSGGPPVRPSGSAPPPSPSATTAPVSPPPPRPTPGASSPSPTPAPIAAPSARPSPTPAAAVAIAIDRGATAVVSLRDLAPGDSVGRTITVRNTGSLAFRYTVSAAQTASTLLWTDPVGGLQLTVTDSGGSVLYRGPLSGLGTLAGPTVLAPGTTELLRYTFDFPTSAGNAFQGLVQDLTLVFDAVEYP